MPRGYFKFALLFDENFYPRQMLPLTNNRFKIRHVSMDLKEAGISDKEVYELAIKNSYIVVTFNSKHFKELAPTSKNAGVIVVSNNLELEHVDKKLVSLLTKSKKGDLYGKFNSLS